MRRTLILVALASAALVVGCGSSKSASAPPSPVTTALSYLPADSPFVVSTATTTNPGGQALVNRLPTIALAETAAFAKLGSLGIDYNSDIRPLFGNPIVGALILSPTQTSSSQFVAAWVTKDASKLTALVKKLTPGLQQVGSRDGATVYQLGQLGLAIDGATVVFGSTPEALTAALDRHAHGGGITGADYARAFSGLPTNARLQVFGTLTQVLSRPSAAKAQQVPWVAALRGYAASVDANSTGLSFRYRLDTTGRALSSSELPFAGGTTPPGFAGSLPIVAGIRNPSQIYQFAESAEQATSPHEYQQFLQRQAKARAKTGVDINSLVKLATGDLIVDSDTHTTMGRVQVSDPAAAKTTIAKLASVPASLTRKPPKITNLGGGFYTIKSGRSKPVTVGLVGDELVAGQGTPAALRTFAATPAVPASGAQGAVAFRVALADVIRLASKKAPSGIGAKIIDMLGDLTGWSAAAPSGITGAATVSFK
jgi:hypothetical protein